MTLKVFLMDSMIKVRGERFQDCVYNRCLFLLNFIGLLNCDAKKTVFGYGGVDGEEVCVGTPHSINFSALRGS